MRLTVSGPSMQKAIREARAEIVAYLRGDESGVTVSYSGPSMQDVARSLIGDGGKKFTNAGLVAATTGAPGNEVNVDHIAAPGNSGAGELRGRLKGTSFHGSEFSHGDSADGYEGCTEADNASNARTA